MADALTDILYVTYGAGHAFGIDLDKCFHEVQNSNMSKLDENGSPIYNKDGKVMKGPKYFKPDLKNSWLIIGSQKLLYSHKKINDDYQFQKFLPLPVFQYNFSHLR